MTNWLILMVKEPHPGRVKTRLARDIGHVDAAWWFRHQSARLIRRLRDPRWQLALAVAPDAEGLRSRVWPADLPRIPQGFGSLGQRMTAIFPGLSPGPVCIIGSDIPGITRRHIASAFTALGSSDAVIGPAPDGGYWLIGLKGTAAVPASLLDGVRWSTAHARADTERALAPRRIAYIDTLRDIDRLADLQAAPDR